MHNKLAFIKTKPPANKNFLFYIKYHIKYIQLEYRKCNRAAEDLTERKSVNTLRIILMVDVPVKAT